ncbi:MAG: Fis family transcriptional regulator [Clostridiaceae bacterium]|nr:Fis family transcriptional regulator [Clostridiaceae bacterium]
MWSKVIDHISRDRLDNRKINLRHVSQQQNVLNRGISKNNSTGYKGVYFDKQRKKYVAEIMCGGRKHHLGRFDTAKKAAIAYNRKAVKLFGEYAFLNARCRYTPSPAFACGQAV